MTIDDFVCVECGWSEAATRLNEAGHNPTPEQRWHIHRLLEHHIPLPTPTSNAANYASWLNARLHYDSDPESS